MSGEKEIPTREERLLIGSERNNYLSIFYRKRTALKTKLINGGLNWGYRALFGSHSSNSAGVCILFNNNFNLEIHKVFLDPSGRFIICDIKADQKLLTLANVYSPNVDDPNFFNSLFDHLRDFKCEEMAISISC